MQATLPLPLPTSAAELPANSAAATPARPARATAAARSPFLPMLIGGLAMLAWSGFQVWQLDVERHALGDTLAAQQPLVDKAAQLRASLDALAADTQRLADAGNPNARLLVDELRRKGVTINSAAPAAAPAKVTPP